MDTGPCISATASFTGGGRNSITIIRDYPPTWGQGVVESLPPRSLETRKRKNLRHPSSPMTDQPWRITFLPTSPFHPSLCFTSVASSQTARHRRLRWPYGVTDKNRYTVSLPRIHTKSLVEERKKKKKKRTLIEEDTVF